MNGRIESPAASLSIRIVLFTSERFGACDLARRIQLRELLGLVAPSFDLAASLAQADYRCYVAFVEQRPIGLILGGRTGDQLELFAVAVHPDFRRLGVARQLLSQLGAVARRASCSEIYLEVRSSNHSAIELYRSAGFDAVRVRRGYYSEPEEDALVMALDLNRDLPDKKRWLTAPLLRREIVGNAYHVLTFDLPQGLPARAGQFVMVRGSEWGDAPLLPRPMSLLTAGVNPSILIKVVGAGTLRMGRADPGESYDLLGPLGTTWQAPQAGRQPVLVAGGVGVAPLLFLARDMAEDGLNPCVLYGGRSAQDLPLLDELEAVSEVRVTTEDGSRGNRGRVTDILDELIGDDAQLFTCGPDRMMAKVAEFAAGRRLPCQASLETPMACGYGVCLGCAVAKVDGQYLYACMQGPCVDARQVDWNQPHAST